MLQTLAFLAKLAIVKAHNVLFNKLYLHSISRRFSTHNGRLLHATASCLRVANPWESSRKSSEVYSEIHAVQSTILAWVTRFNLGNSRRGLYRWYNWSVSLLGYPQLLTASLTWHSFTLCFIRNKLLPHLSVMAFASRTKTFSGGCVFTEPLLSIHLPNWDSVHNAHCYNVAVDC